MRVEEVRAVVTGGGSGLGRYFCVQLAKAGAAVVAGDINMRGLEETQSEGQSFAGALFTERLDVSQENSVEQFVAIASRQLGGLNLLVNCAGVLRDGALATKEEKWVKRLPLAQWRQVIDTNLSGGYLMAREVAADMQRDGAGGVIINISSLARSGNIGQSAYSASKAGLDACTRTWAIELAGCGIRVGGIAPGLIDTPMLEHISPEHKEQLVRRIPLGRIGTPHEIWLAIQFIIECDYFTGRVIEIDGGLTF